MVGIAESDIILLLRLLNVAAVGASIAVSLHINRVFSGVPYGKAARLLPFLSIGGLIYVILQIAPLNIAGVAADQAVGLALSILGLLFIVQLYALLRRR